MTSFRQRRAARSARAQDAATVIAFYLPQYHPVPENDAWWGQGFTEWTNVVTAKPLYEGHHQPNLPGDLGFYDLRVPEVREQQAALAKAHGIDAFCYYHYWFGGRRVLDRVLDEVLRSGTPDLPFCLCWANENWTRAWDASDQEVLLGQEYGPEEREEHVRYLVDAFRDPRYLRHDGRPLFAIYRIQALPDPQGFVARLREVSIEAGTGDPHIVKFDTHGRTDDPADHGCDAAGQFIPHGLMERVPPMVVPEAVEGSFICDYEEVARHLLDQEPPPWTRHECVSPAWDNTPRRGPGRSFVLHGASPEGYERWLRTVVERAPERGGLVFINAWNEWAEGAYLEPDQRRGRAYLEATARAVLGEVPEPEPLASLGAPETVVLGPRFADLYLDLYERYVQLQRRLTATESMLQRRLEGADEARQIEEATALVASLRAQIAGLEARLAQVAPAG